MPAISKPAIFIGYIKSDPVREDLSRLLFTYFRIPEHDEWLVHRRFLSSSSSSFTYINLYSGVGLLNSNTGKA